MKGREGKGREGKGREKSSSPAANVFMYMIIVINCYQNFVSLYFEVREFSSYSRGDFRCRSLVLSIYVFLCNFPANIPKVIV